MSRTFVVSKEFVLHRLLNHGAMDRQFDELEKRLPDMVELHREFVERHALDLDWVTAMEKLLEGQHLVQAMARETQAAEALRLAIKQIQDDYKDADYTTIEALQEHEKATNRAWNEYDRVQARIFIEVAKAQGGWEIERGRA